MSAPIEDFCGIVWSNFIFLLLKNGKCNSPVEYNGVADLFVYFETKMSFESSCLDYFQMEKPKKWECRPCKQLM